MAHPTMALQLATDGDAHAYAHAEDLPGAGMLDDNGAPPDGNAWLVWDSAEMTEEDAETAAALGIDARLQSVYVTEYDVRLVDARDHTWRAPWCGHQTTDSAAWADAEDARIYEYLLEQAALAAGEE